jgi:hypothetical protein
MSAILSDAELSIYQFAAKSPRSTVIARLLDEMLACKVI